MPAKDKISVIQLHMTVFHAQFDTNLTQLFWRFLNSNLSEKMALSSLSVDIYYPQAKQRGNVTNETGRIPEINTRA